MKVALVGYGKMGRLLDELAPEYGADVTLRLDEHNNANGAGMTPENFAGIQVAIEFSIPSVTVANIERLAALGVHVVVGTTGWTEQLDRVQEVVARTGIGLVWSPNYSIGVNVFMKIVAEAARLMQPQPQYGASAWEIHHAAKKDAPSGTMLKLLDEMRHHGYTHNVDVASNRGGAHPGTHEILFDSGADTIALRHTARSREGFARGAWMAAQWIAGKNGCHEFSEVLFGEEKS